MARSLTSAPSFSTVALRSTRVPFVETVVRCSNKHCEGIR